MVSFRNLFLALPLAGMLAGVASAQAPIQYSCSASAANNVVRQEGLSELAGTVTVNCTILNPQAVAITQVGYVQVKTDGPNITNLMTDKTNKVTTATMTTNLAGATAGYGTLVGQNEVDFNNVTFSFAANATNFQIVIANVHVNANQVSSGTPVKLFVTALAGYPNNTTQPLQVLLVNAPVTVAQVQTGLAFTVSPYTANQLVQCAATPAPTTANSTQASLVFTPGFPLAFKATEALDYAGTTIAATPVGAVINGAGTPDKNQGTQLIARFKVPTNAKLWVANVVTAGPGNKAVASLDPTITDPATVPAWTEIKAATDGSYTATWTVTALDPGNLAAAFSMPVAISYGTDPAVATTALSANGNLGPMSSIGVSTSDVKVNSPRFIDGQGAYQTLIPAINLCSSTLLFPHVTSVGAGKGGWETGIVISNPSLDVKKADGTYLLGNAAAIKAQTGTCSLYFFNDDGSTPTAQTTTGNIPAGGQFVYLLGTTGSVLPDTSIAAVANFQGYIIAQCGFQGASGFAFMTSGAGQGGVGYKATVIGNQFGSAPLNPLFY